jgi:hypothetical protein
MINDFLTDFRGSQKSHNYSVLVPRKRPSVRVPASKWGGGFRFCRSILRVGFLGFFDFFGLFGSQPNKFWKSQEPQKTDSEYLLHSNDWPTIISRRSRIEPRDPNSDRIVIESTNIMMPRKFFCSWENYSCIWHPSLELLPHDQSQTVDLVCLLRTIGDLNFFSSLGHGEKKSRRRDH